MNAYLDKRIREHQARITIIGQGYVGLPLAIEFCKSGFKVFGLDDNRQRVDELNCGCSHTPDVSAKDLQILLEKELYIATTDASVLECSDVVIICVPTPLRKSKDPDITYVATAASQVAERLQSGQLIILESTTYPGTTMELILPLLATDGRAAGTDFFLAFSPERIDPANSKFKVRDIPKVVGGVTPACSEMAALLYGQIINLVHKVSSPTIAELAKLYENVFRSVNIALANEFALMCQRLDVSTREVIDAAATKPFGFLPFQPGPGVGGHCIAVDSAYLAWKMRLNGYDARFIHLAEEINRSMPAHVVEMIGSALNRKRICLNGAHILILGVAYKRGVGDTRESPAIDVISRLRSLGAEVTYADPYVPSVQVEGVNLQAVEITDALLSTSNAVVVLTDHEEFDYSRIASLASLIIDTRNATWGLSQTKTNEVIRL
jgi:UDP-N-acetyl-D-glucosamine dehydrogenase